MSKKSTWHTFIIDSMGVELGLGCVRYQFQGLLRKLNIDGDSAQYQLLIHFEEGFAVRSLNFKILIRRLADNYVNSWLISKYEILGNDTVALHFEAHPESSFTITFENLEGAEWQGNPFVIPESEQFHIVEEKSLSEDLLLLWAAEIEDLLLFAQNAEQRNRLTGQLINFYSERSSKLAARIKALLS